MKSLSLLIMLFGMSLYAEEARIVVKCDPKIKIVVNGQLQNDSGPERGYSIDSDGIVEVFSYFDNSASSNLVVNSTKVQLQPGKTIEIDFRTDAQKQAEKSKTTRINFSLFGKESLKKTDFNSIMGDKKKEEPKNKFTPVQKSSVGYTAESCATGQCTTRR